MTDSVEAYLKSQLKKKKTALLFALIDSEGTDNNSSTKLAKEVEKIGKKVLSAEYEKVHLTMEMQSRQGIATSEDALKYGFVDEETFLKSEKKKSSSGSRSGGVDALKKNKNAFAERRLEDELERRKDLLERIEAAKERIKALERSRVERKEKKREAENAIRDLKRTAAMVFKTIHCEKKTTS